MGYLQNKTGVVVDYLTLSERVPVRQPRPDGTGKLVHVSIPARLRLLENRAAATRSGMKARGGLPSERNVLDWEALDYLRDVARNIRAWCEDAHVPRTGYGDLSGMLRAWHARTLKLSDSAYPDHVAEMRRWGRWIDTTLIDVKHTAQITEKCPRCEEDDYYTPQGLMMWPLAVVYVEGDMDLTHATAHCRSCGEAWRIEDGGARALMWEIEHNPVSAL